jgi:hypothetical protein
MHTTQVKPNKHVDNATSEHIHKLMHATEMQVCTNLHHSTHLQ